MELGRIPPDTCRSGGTETDLVINPSPLRFRGREAPNHRCRRTHYDLLLLLLLLLQFLQILISPLSISSVLDSPLSISVLESTRHRSIHLIKGFMGKEMEIDDQNSNNSDLIYPKFSINGLSLPPSISLFCYCLFFCWFFRVLICLIHQCCSFLNQRNLSTDYATGTMLDTGLCMVSIVFLLHCRRWWMHYSKTGALKGLIYGFWITYHSRV